MAFAIIAHMQKQYVPGAFSHSSVPEKRLTCTQATFFLFIILYRITIPHIEHWYQLLTAHTFFLLQITNQQQVFELLV